MISMQCKTCGGVLDVDDEHEVLFCPYCGDKAIFEDSDNVKIERIRQRAAIERRQQEYEIEKEKQKEGIKFLKKYFIITGIIVLFFFGLAFVCNVLGI